ncbi:MAG: hypothetical protein JSS58_11135 [Proteobacteria bacterium]|nr:hypothetical protein [Pseudomonadota bacterium]
MKPSHSFRLVTALVALISVLFTQLAVAAYACPGMKIEQVSQAVAMPMEDHQAMSGCAGMDDVQPGLCHAHDHAGNQSLDKPELPLIQPFVPTGFVLAIGFTEIIDRPLTARPTSIVLTRAAAPPLAIRNCCFRI